MGMVNESNNNFASSINSATGRASGRRYSGNTDNDATTNRADNLRTRIANNRSSFVSRGNNSSSRGSSSNEISSSSSKSSSVVPGNNSATTSSNAASVSTSSTGLTTTSPSPQALTREQKLDRVLNLLEDITGEDISQNELSKILKSLDNKPDYTGPKVSGNQLRDSSEKTLTKAPAKDSGVQPHEEAAFSNFKVEFYESQTVGLQILHDEWAGSSKPEARQQMAQIKAQMNLVDAATNFWEGRAESWQWKMEADKPQVGDDAFSTFKQEFYKAQLTGLENLMDQWVTVEDDSGAARSQIAQINSQINLVEAADEFWGEENQFWRQEHKSEYKLDDQETVKQVYSEIEDLQNQYDEVLLGGGSGSAAVIKAELEKTKDKLDQLRIGENYDPGNGSSFKTNFSENKTFSEFKLDFYDSQTKGLNNLIQEWQSVEDDSGAANKQIAQIRIQTNLVGTAKRFWKEQNEFWKGLEEKDFASENAGKLKELTNKAAGFESKIDELFSSEDGSGAHRAEIANARAELNSVKADIYSLAV